MMLGSKPDWAEVEGKPGDALERRDVSLAEWRGAGAGVAGAGIAAGGRGARRGTADHDAFESARCRLGGSSSEARSAHTASRSRRRPSMTSSQEARPPDDDAAASAGGMRRASPATATAISRCSCARRSSRARATPTTRSTGPCRHRQHRQRLQPLPRQRAAADRGGQARRHAGRRPADGFPDDLASHESFAQPTSMYLRNLMSMDTEEMIRAQPMDAVVLIGGCDKTVPAQLMGAASAGIPAIQLVTGSMLTGSHRGERVGACTDCRRYWATLSRRGDRARKSRPSTTSSCN